MLSHPKYIDPTTDYGFKRIFASEPNKELLIAFLNELFRGRKTIIDLVYDKNEHVGDTEKLGVVILDLTCTGSDGTKFIIEVQRSPQLNFKKRIIYYQSKLVADQAPKGGRRSWGYDIVEVYIIALMDGFRLPDSEDTARYLHDIRLCHRDTGKVFYENLGYIFIELVNFTKEETALETDLDGWLYVLKNMSRMDKIPTYLRKPIFQKLFHIAEYSKLNKEEKTMYDTSLKRKWDNQSALDFARKEGMEKGKIVEVRNLITKLGLSDQQAAEVAEVSVEFVQKVRRELKDSQ